MKRYQAELRTAALTGTGLMAGIFFAFSVAVMPGLSALEDRKFLSAFREINRSIQNPVFLSLFFATPVLLLLVAYLRKEKYYWQIAIAYLVGVMAVTMFGNIPLNLQLEQMNPAFANPIGLTAFRHRFELRWTWLNHIRTVFSTGCLYYLARAPR